MHSSERFESNGLLSLMLIGERQCHCLMSMSEEALQLAQGCILPIRAGALCPQTQGGAIAFRDAPSQPHPAAEIRSRKSRSASALVSFFRQIRARPASWNRSKLSIRKSRRAGRRHTVRFRGGTQMKPDRLFNTADRVLRKHG